MDQELTEQIEEIQVSIKRYLPPVERVVATLPWFTFASFSAFAAYVRTNLGHWPRPMVESVQLPYGQLFENLISTSCTGCLISLPAIFLLLIIRIACRFFKGLLVSMVIFLVGLFAIFLFTNYSPGRFFDWWID